MMNPKRLKNQVINFLTSMSLLIDINTASCKLGSLQGYMKKRKMNEFKEKKNGKGRHLRLPRLS